MATKLTEAAPLFGANVVTGAAAAAIVVGVGVGVGVGVAAAAVVVAVVVGIVVAVVVGIVVGVVASKSVAARLAMAMVVTGRPAPLSAVAISSGAFVFTESSIPLASSALEAESWKSTFRPAASRWRRDTSVTPSTWIRVASTSNAAAIPAENFAASNAGHQREGFAHLTADLRRAVAADGFEWVASWDGFAASDAVPPAAAEARTAVFELARLHASKGNRSLALGLYREVAGRWLAPVPYATAATRDGGGGATPPSCSVEVFLSLLGLAWLGEAAEAPWDEVSRFLDRARRCDPSHPEPLAMVAVHMHASGDAELALAYARLVLARPFSSPRWRWVHRPSVECVAPVLVASHAPGAASLSSHELERLRHAATSCGGESAGVVRAFLAPSG